MVYRIAILFFLIAASGCVPNWIVRQETTCTAFQRRWRDSEIKVYTDQVDRINDIKEWLGPPTYTNVFLLPTQELRALGVVTVTLSISGVEKAMLGKCFRTSESQQACWIQDNVLEKAGFYLAVVAPDVAEDEKLVESL